MKPIPNRSHPSIFCLVACVMALAGCGRSENGETPAASVASAPPGSPAAEAAPAETPAAVADESAAAQGEETACDAEPVKDAIGKPFTPELGEDVRARSGSKVFRALKPGDVVTMEFRFDRVNLALDDKGIVTAVTCG